MSFVKEYFECRREFNLSFVKYLKCRKHFKKIDEKIKNPLAKRLLKQGWIKNLWWVVEDYDETPLKGVRLALYSNPSKVHWYDTKFCVWYGSEVRA